MRIVKDRTDEQLLTTGRRDEGAVAELLDRYWEVAYRVALRLTHDPGAAEDAAQSAFLKALSRSAQFDRAQRFRPWFFAVVANEARMIDRARSRRAHHEARASRSPESRDAEHVDAVDAVRTHLAALPEVARQAIRLHYLDGLTHEETGAVLGLPKGTVSSRIRRGLRELRGRVGAATLAVGGASLTALLEASDDTTVPAAPPPRPCSVARPPRQPPAVRRRLGPPRPRSSPASSSRSPRPACSSRPSRRTRHRARRWRRRRRTTPESVQSRPSR